MDGDRRIVLEDKPTSPKEDLMPHDLVRRRQTEALTPREQREVSRDLTEAQMPAKRAAAKIQAAAFTTHTALTCVEMLTNLEQQAAERQGPMVDARARMIVDQYTGLCATELAKLAMGG